MQMLLDFIYHFGSSVVYVTFELCYHAPVTSTFIAAIILLWSKTFLGELDLSKYAFTFKHGPQKGQWWRLLTSPFFHQNPVHMLMNVLILWQCRRVEKYEGSLFVLRNTIILAIAEGIFSLCMIYFIAMGIRSRTRWQQSMMGGIFADPLGERERSLVDIIVAQPFGSKPKCGFSGISLAWVSYMMIMLPMEPFYLLGVFPIQTAFAPVAVIMLFLVVEPHHHAPSKSAGFLCGLLLAARLLQVMPNLYWSVSFIFDLALLLAFQHCEAAHIQACRRALDTMDDSISHRDTGTNNASAWERRYIVPKSLLAFIGDTDEGLEVRMWPSPPTIETARQEMPEPESAGRGDVEMREMVDVERGERDGEAGGASAAGTLAARRGARPLREEDDVDTENGDEFKEWDSLLTANSGGR